MGRPAFIALLLLLGATLVAEPIHEATSVELGTAITVFGLAFGAWAVVLGYVMVIIRREFHELREFVREEASHRRNADDRAHHDRLQLERRLTEIETYWRSQNHGRA